MNKLRNIFSIFLLVPLFLLITTNATGENGEKKQDSNPPTPPTGLSVSGKTCTSISLNWTGSTDNIKVKGYYVYRDGKKIITTSKTYYTNSDLVPGRKYTYSIKAYDASGNISAASDAISAVANADCQSPTTPAGVAVSSAGLTSLDISWNSCTDNTGIKGYVVYRNGSKAASTAATSYTAKGLLPGTSYSFFVKAYDIAGNYSGQSFSVTGTTLPDGQAPGKPFGLKAASVSETQITLMWSPSSDNVKVKGYEVYCNGEKKGSPARTIFNAKNLVPGTSYKYSVIAVDTVGNKSGYSETIVISTLNDTKKPSAPTGLKVVKTKGSSVSLEWNASTDNTKVDCYIIYCNGIELAKSRKTSRTVRDQSKLGIGVYWVKAFDLSGNGSDSSNKITVITP